MGPGAPRGPGRPAMMVSMTVEASWGSPSVLKSRAVSVPAGRAAQSQQAGLHSKILRRLLLAKGRKCFRMQNLGSWSNWCCAL